MSSSTCSGGVEGGSETSEPGSPACGGPGELVDTPDAVEARRVEFVELDEVVES